MQASTLWWIATELLVASELVTGTFYQLMLAVGLAGALAARMGANSNVQKHRASGPRQPVVRALPWRGRPGARRAHHPRVEMGEGTALAIPSLNHDTFSRNTRNQLRQVFDALRELTTTPPEPPKRPIGFVTPEDKDRKTMEKRGKT